jgi:hypothetical protein
MFEARQRGDGGERYEDTEPEDGFRMEGDGKGIFDGYGRRLRGLRVRRDETATYPGVW